MAGLISTGIWGFICSATMKAGKITATFISGATGWIIKNNGDAEFKSIYARDKITGLKFETRIKGNIKAIQTPFR